MNTNFIIISVATDYTEGLNRFISSITKYNIEYKMLGLNTIWNGGDMEKGSGGGQKVNLLKTELNSWNNEQLSSTIILFSDSYDVINVSTKTEILNKYYNIINHNPNIILFSTEKICWPNPLLEKYYPQTEYSYKFLNSGGFIGNAKCILEIIKEQNIKDNDDDQLYYTKIFLFNNKSLTTNKKIQLDYNCEIFQTLNNAINDITINNSNNRLTNNIFNTKPCLIHGNGPKNIKQLLQKLNL